MRILLIAPATDLPFAPAEVAAVANTPGHTVHQMQGEVNRRDLLAEATRQDVRYDVLWFATHGSRDGVLMSDGLIGIASLAPLVLAVNAKLVVLNTCDSYAVGEAVAWNTGVATICTVAAIPDDRAFELATYLALHLARFRGDVQKAFDAVQPSADADYRLILPPVPPTRGMAHMTDDYERRDDQRRDTGIADNTRQIVDLRLAITELRTKIDNLQMTQYFIAAVVVAIVIIAVYIARTGGL